jgi:hypothetical protein
MKTMLAVLLLCGSAFAQPAALKFSQIPAMSNPFCMMDQSAPLFQAFCDTSVPHYGVLVVGRSDSPLPNIRATVRYTTPDKPDVIQTATLVVAKFYQPDGFNNFTAFVLFSLTKDFTVQSVEVADEDVPKTVANPEPGRVY